MILMLHSFDLESLRCVTLKKGSHQRWFEAIPISKQILCGWNCQKGKQLRSLSPSSCSWQDVGQIGSPRIRFFPVVHLARAFLKNLHQKVLDSWLSFWKSPQRFAVETFFFFWKKTIPKAIRKVFFSGGKPFNTFAMYTSSKPSVQGHELPETWNPNPRSEKKRQWGGEKWRAMDLELWSFDVGGFSIIKYGNNWTMTKESATVRFVVCMISLGQRDLRLPDVWTWFRAFLFRAFLLTHVFLFCREAQSFTFYNPLHSKQPMNWPMTNGLNHTNRCRIFWFDPSIVFRNPWPLFTLL